MVKPPARYLVLTQFQNKYLNLIGVILMSHGRALQEVERDKADDPHCVCRIFAIKARVST